jgi:hypothetical protein
VNADQGIVAVWPEAPNATCWSARSRRC